MTRYEDKSRGLKGEVVPAGIEDIASITRVMREGLVALLGKRRKRSFVLKNTVLETDDVTLVIGDHPKGVFLYLVPKLDGVERDMLVRLEHDGEARA